MNGTGVNSLSSLRAKKKESRDRSRQDRVWERGKTSPPSASKRSHVSHGVRHLLLHHYKAISAPPFVDVSRAVETALYLPLPRTRDVPRLLPDFWVKSLRGRRGRKGGTSGSRNVRVSSPLSRCATRLEPKLEDLDSIEFEDKRLVADCLRFNFDFSESSKLGRISVLRVFFVNTWDKFLIFIEWCVWMWKEYVLVCSLKYRFSRMEWSDIRWTHVKFWKTCNSPGRCFSSLVGERKEVWNVKVDGSCERNSPRCIISRVGQFSQVRGKNFSFYAAFEIYIYIFQDIHV